jgi:hypothetical protein
MSTTSLHTAVFLTAVTGTFFLEIFSQKKSMSLENTLLIQMVILHLPRLADGL